MRRRHVLQRLCDAVPSTSARVPCRILLPRGVVQRRRHVVSVHDCAAWPFLRARVCGRCWESVPSCTSHRHRRHGLLVYHNCVARTLHALVCTCVFGTQGQYSAGGGEPCSPCAAGFFCDAGSASPRAASCGREAPGYYCGAGSTSAIGQPCPAVSCTARVHPRCLGVSHVSALGCVGGCCGLQGQYSQGGGAPCTPCQVGFACPAASTNATAVPCGSTPAPGFACLAGSTTTFGVACPSGTFSQGAGAPCLPCSAAPGYVCAAASTTSEGTPCPPGRYGGGDASPSCAACPAAAYCLGGGDAPTGACGGESPGWFCLPGSSSPSGQACPAVSAACV